MNVFAKFEESLLKHFWAIIFTRMGQTDGQNASDQGCRLCRGIKSWLDRLQALVRMTLSSFYSFPHNLWFLQVIFTEEDKQLLCISIIVSLIYCHRVGEYSKERVRCGFARCVTLKRGQKPVTPSIVPCGIPAKTLICNYIFKEWCVSYSIVFGGVVSSCERTLWSYTLTFTAEV